VGEAENNLAWRVFYNWDGRVRNDGTLAGSLGGAENAMITWNPEWKTTGSSYTSFHTEKKNLL